MRVDNFNGKYHQLKRMMKKISGSPLCNVSSDNEALAAAGAGASPTPGTCETSADDKFLFNWVQKPECETISHVISHCGRGSRGRHQSGLLPQIDPSVPQPVEQSRRRPLLGPSPG